MFDRPDLRQASAAALAPTGQDPMPPCTAAVDAVVDQLVSHLDGELGPGFLSRYNDHAAAHDEIGAVPAGPVDLAQARAAGQARAERLITLLEHGAPEATASGPASAGTSPSTGDRPARRQAVAGRRSGVYDQFRAHSHDRGEAPRRLRLRLWLSAASTSAALGALSARATTLSAASLGARTGRAVATAARWERLVDAQPISPTVARPHPVAVPQPNGQRLDGP